MITCPACARDNPDGFRFCGFCSAPLEARTAPVEERKVVSVLFCDLVGFTARSERSDPEDVRARLVPYHDRVKKEIEAFAGTVEKFVGDAVMAVFGAPVQHEDDAERAVRAGLRILEAIDDMNHEDPDVGLAVRIAVNTGETLVAVGARPELGEAMVAGDVVNTASRLQGAAPVGSIVVGEQTYLATARVFEWEELDAVELKGKSEPTPLWRALAPRGRFGVDIMRAPTTPFVGREDDLALLQHVYQRTIREQELQLVTIVGEPGVGKSRLVAELGRYLDNQHELVTWRQGRSLPYGDGIVFWALGEIVKAQAGILDSDAPDVAEAKLGVALSTIENADDRAWMLRRIAPLVGAGESGVASEQEESFTAWRRFLEHLTASGPAVLVFEDLHWADPTLIEFLEYLVEWVQGVPMLLVCSARPDLFDRHPRWGGGKRNTTTIDVTPLDQEETARLVHSLLGAIVMPADVQAKLLDRAGGNPLYAEEFVRMLQDRGLLIERGNAIVSTGDIPVPQSVQALIAARLDALPPDLKTALQDAAVVGKVFWSGSISAIGGREPSEVRAALHELSKRELIRPARSSSMAGDDEFAFWHALIRDVAYGQIPRSARVDKHISAAGWIEKMAGDRARDLADVIATHLLEALELARSAGREVAGLQARAQEAVLQAGERALRVNLPRAIELFDRAIGLSSEQDVNRARALAGRGSAARLLGDLAGGAEHLERAAELFLEGGLAEDAAAAMLDLALARSWSGDDAAFKRWLAKTMSVLEPLGPSRTLARTYRMAANDHQIDGRLEEASSYIEQANEVATHVRASDLEPEIDFERGMIQCQLGDVSGLTTMRQAIEGVLTQGETARAQLLLANLGATAGRVTGFAESLQALQEALQLADRLGPVPPFLEISFAVTLSGAGRWDEALELIGRVETGEWWEESSFDQLEARTARLRMRLARGQAAVEDASAIQTLLEMTSDPRARINSAGPLASYYLRAGDRSASEDILRVLQSTENIDADFLLVILPETARIAIQLRRADLVRALILDPKAKTPGAKASLVSVRGSLAESEGSDEEAVALYESASDLQRPFDVLEQAHALFGLGRCELRLGRREAEDHLRAARNVFVGLGATPLVAEIDVLLGAAEAQSP